jgi:hypothetical protein
MGDFRQNDEKRQKREEVAWCYCNKRRLIDRKRRGENWKLAFNGNYISRGVWQNDMFRTLHKGNRSIQKRDRWRRGDGGSEMGGDGVKVSEQILAICFGGTETLT